MPKTETVPTAEAAQIVGKSVKTFLRWKEAGRIEPVAKLPGLRGAYLFDRSDVEALTPADAPSSPSPGEDGAAAA